MCVYVCICVYVYVLVSVYVDIDACSHLCVAICRACCPLVDSCIE